jgi:hypothetical protein
MLTIHFPNHGEKTPEYPIYIEVSLGKARYTTRGGRCRIWIERWDTGWVVQEVSGDGGAVVADALGSETEAMQWALLFLACEGGYLEMETR